MHLFWTFEDKFGELEQSFNLPCWCYMERGRLRRDLSPTTCRSPDWSCSAAFPRSFCVQGLDLLGPVYLGISFSEHRTYYNSDGLNHIDHIPGTKVVWFELVNITNITLFHTCPQLKMFGSLHPWAHYNIFSIETSQGFFLNKAHCKPCPSLHI